jgi:hypothetical protein
MNPNQVPRGIQGFFRPTMPPAGELPPLEFVPNQEALRPLTQQPAIAEAPSNASTPFPLSRQSLLPRPPLPDMMIVDSAPAPRVPPKVAQQHQSQPQLQAPQMGRSPMLAAFLGGAKSPAALPATTTPAATLPESSASHQLEMKKFNGPIHAKYNLPERYMRNYLIKETGTTRLVSIIEVLLNNKKFPVKYNVEGEIYHYHNRTGTLPLIRSFISPSDDSHLFFGLMRAEAGLKLQFYPLERVEATNAFVLRSTQAVYYLTDPDPRWLPLVQISAAAAQVISSLTKRPNPPVDELLAELKMDRVQLARTYVVLQYCELPVLERSPTFMVQLSKLAAQHGVHDAYITQPPPKKAAPKKRKLPDTLATAAADGSTPDPSTVPAAKRRKVLEKPVIDLDAEEDGDESKMKQSTLEFGAPAPAAPRRFTRPLPLPSKLEDVRQVLPHHIDDPHFAKCLMIWQFIRIRTQTLACLLSISTVIAFP